jgi:hypothetical protein
VIKITWLKKYVCDQQRISNDFFVVIIEGLMPARPTAGGVNDFFSVQNCFLDKPHKNLY